MTKAGGKPRKRVSANVYVFAALALSSFSLLLFSTRSFVINIQDTGLSIFSGIRGAIHTVSSTVSDTLLAAHELLALRDEYDKLLERVTQYEYLERSSTEIRAENNRLREQLGFSQNLSYKHIPAEVSGHDPDNIFSAFVINKGKMHGIENNMPVIAFQGGMQALVGKVVQTGQVESLVMPLYDQRCFVSARLAHERYDGIVEGQGMPAYPLLMRSITKRARDDVKTGDIVVSSGMGGVYPDSIIIGRVSKIIFLEYETSIELELESAIDFSRLEYVFVIKEKNE
ncbi:MAG: rod shape-determining protein MreC [Spirochaetaceae bacterium]|jgi:rod shape-determining protein MreC|nr:rod shape-determining protein MreC [Spirochaetaceae bacterium]